MTPTQARYDSQVGLDSTVSMQQAFAEHPSVVQLKLLLLKASVPMFDLQ
jgi:hypothetical protein